jgi:hypothetical protein
LFGDYVFIFTFVSQLHEANKKEMKNLVIIVSQPQPQHQPQSMLLGNSLPIDTGA